MWFLPLIAAALQSVDDNNKKQKEIQDAADDTANRIRQSHASKMGADPSLGMLSDLETNLSRFERDYQPPENAVGKAIQAIGGGGGNVVPGRGSYEIAPEQHLGESYQLPDDELIDPWKQR